MLRQPVHHDCNRFFGGAALLLGLLQCLVQLLVLARGGFGYGVYYVLPFFVVGDSLVAEVDEGQPSGVGRLGGELEDAVFGPDDHQHGPGLLGLLLWHWEFLWREGMRR